MIWVENQEEVREVVRVARTHRVPIIPFGAGTSLEGHINAPRGGPVARLLAHEPGARRQRARPRLRGGARRLAQAAQRLSARHGPVLPRRPRRRGGDHRRHGLHARLRHHRRALRHHARERAEPHRRDGRRLGRQDGAARAQVRRRLRPDAAAGRLGGHARHHHRGHRAPLRHPRDDPLRRVPVRDAGRRLQRRDPVDPAGARRRPHGAAGPAADPRRQHPRQARPGGEADAVPRVPRHRGRRARPGRAVQGRSPRARARSASTGPRRRRTAAGCGRPGTKPTGPSRPRGPARTRFATDVCVPISRLAECVVETQKDIEALGPHRADRRPRRRRQLPHLAGVRPQQPQGDGGGRDLPRAPDRARHRHGRHLHRRARRRPGQGQVPRRPSWATASPSCARSRPRWTRWTFSIRARSFCLRERCAGSPLPILLQHGESDCLGSQVLWHE